MSKRYISIGVLCLSGLATCFVSINCNGGGSGNQEKKVVATDGKSLSVQYCQSCHLYPDASMLDQDTWANHVLPAMAPHLGIKVYGENEYINNPSASSAIAYDDWIKIVDYYSTKSPKTLSPAKKPIAARTDWGVFSLVKPLNADMPMATTTMVAFDTIGKRIFTSDAAKSSLYQWSANNVKLQSSQVYDSPAVDAQFSRDEKGNEQGIFTFIGSMDAVDVSNGFVTAFGLSGDNKTERLIADKLPRPIQSVSADFNRDGVNDFVVCGFGHNKGGLYLYTQLPGKQYEKHELSAMPGAEHAITGDFNNDGWPDIACLFAHADEGIWMFLNDHKGGFTSKNIIRFPAVYGSSSFQLVDFNHDGKLDLLYTSGDNSDFSRILKPYHGLYIYLNQGDFKFKQSYFYPINGATKAVAADFNGDGNLDIAVIAFFSNLKTNPGEGFTYFEQDSPMHFIPHNLPIYNNGRWICMDVNDYNGDGKPDVILGNFSMGFVVQEDVKPSWNTHIPFIILKNISEKKQGN